MKHLGLILLLLAGGVCARLAQASELRAPRSVTRRGLSQDLEFNLQSLHGAGLLSKEKMVGVLEAYKDGAYEADVHLPDDWVGDNFWVDKLGKVHRRVNGPDGKYHASKDPVRLVVDIFPLCLCVPRCSKPKECPKMIFILIRDSCRNIMVGPVPRPEKPAVVIWEKPETIFVEKRVEVPVEKIVTVTKEVIVKERVEVPVEVIREVPVEVEVIREVLVPVPVREKSGYFPGQPGRLIRSEHVAAVFAFQRDRVTNVNRRVIIRRERPPFKPPGQPPRGINHGNKGPRQPTLPTWDVRP